MILSGQTIRSLCQPRDVGGIVSNREMITPFVERSVSPTGKSFGLGPCSYDIRVASFLDYDGNVVDRIRMEEGDFFLAVALERIKMPNDLCATIRDKSSWAREGLSVFNTHTDPGFEGFLTLELSMKRRHKSILIQAGDPIAQLVFERLDEPAEKPYSGKYQNQPAIPVDSIKEIPNNSTVKTLELDSAEQEALDALR